MEQSALPDDVARSASLLFGGLGTPLSLGVALRLHYGEWDDLANLSADPRSYTDPQSYFRDAVSVSLLKKLQQLPTTVDRRARAIDKWKDGERVCCLSNLRLDRYLPENKVFDLTQEAGISSFFDDVRQTIRSWIGPRPPSLLEGRFGPGATYSDRGGKTTIPDKIAADPSLTTDAVWYLPQWLGTQAGAALAQRQGELSFVPGNRFTTVPKTAMTDRCIAAEPGINVFYQLAIGRSLRRRLKRTTGWDLDHAQDIHRQVACESSRTREFATLDLSNASDTVSRVLVKLCLPHDWHEVLDDLRSKKTLIDGRWVVLEKFSSMGNGFTFELETIIFAALVCVASSSEGHAGILGKDVFVFGDDIICKTDAVRSVKAVLEFCGLALNKEKSFYGDEPFRESCGGDYFDGRNVRPFFLKELPLGPQDYIAFANSLGAIRERLEPLGFCLDRRAWFSVLDCLPSGTRRCRGPKALGDIVIHDDESRWTTRWRGDIRYVRVLRPWRTRLVRYDRFDPQVILACATYGTGGSKRGGVIPRDGVLSYKVGWTTYS